MSQSKIAFAVVAHPDDIEFQMCGTLLLLKNAGYEIHYMNIANGSCGTAQHSKEEIIEIRRTESMRAAGSLGAIHHDSLTDDMGIYYEPALLARMAAIMREVAPDILLVQSPQDYMEDHQNSVRLAVSAAFVLGMKNFQTIPAIPPVEKDIAIYHAQPHGNRNPLGELISPALFVDITSVIDTKQQILACHQSQKRWLDQSQGMNSYIQTMVEHAMEVGHMSGVFKYAEGWRKRLHLGFGSADYIPLESDLSEYLASHNQPDQP
jgi:LmbE family N-acetylglucosaminyl deacetylase